MESILAFFLNEGILGVLVAGEALIVVYIYKKLESCREKRIEDLKAYHQAAQTLQEEKIQMQKKHTDNIMNTQREVNGMVTLVTSTLESLISALAKGVTDD